MNTKTATPDRPDDVPLLTAEMVSELLESNLIFWPEQRAALRAIAEGRAVVSPAGGAVAAPPEDGELAALRERLEKLVNDLHDCYAMELARDAIALAARPLAPQDEKRDRARVKSAGAALPPPDESAP